MRNQMIRTGAILVSLLILAGCSSTSAVTVNRQFPTVVFEPRNINTALLINPEFQTYVAKPNANTTIDIGTAQVDLLSKAFRGLFEQVQVVNSREQVDLDAELVITPSVREVQLSTPSDSYLNVYEVWIKYNLDIETRDGVPIDSWFMPAYGKTPDSFMLSRSDAIEEAANVALRDAGAKLLLDFFRIPSVYSWIEQQQQPQDP